MRFDGRPYVKIWLTLLAPHSAAPWTEVIAFIPRLCRPRLMADVVGPLAWNRGSCGVVDRCRCECLDRVPRVGAGGVGGSAACDRSGKEWGQVVVVRGPTGAGRTGKPIR